jgi:two-component system, NtrC family, sensor kinase
VRNSDKVGGKAGKARRRKAAPKHRNAPKLSGRGISLAAGEKISLALFTRERDEALEQQKATFAVLRAISNAPTDSETTLGAIAESVARLLNVTDAEIIMRVGGDLLECVTKYGPSHNWPVGTTRTLNRDWVTGRAVIDRTVIHVADLRAVEREFPQGAAFARQYGHGTTLAVPLLREGSAIGAILIRRMAVEPFTDRQIELVSSFASQAVIAIENARLFSETKEALAQQTATAEVLKVIASSPGDLAPMFDVMLESAARLCEASHCHVWRFDGHLLHAVAVRGDPWFAEWLQKNSPIAPIPGSAAGRIARGEDIVHVVDRREEEAYSSNPVFRDFVDSSGTRASLSVALRRDGALLGMITVYRQEVRPFSDRQIALLQNFAAQAVLAMENARLVTETRDALEQQTATAEVLKVISRSAFDLDAVLGTLVESAARLCEAERGILFLRKGNECHAANVYGFSPELEAFARAHPIPIDGASTTARAAASGIAVQTVDLLADPALNEVARQYQKLGGHRTNLGVPLKRNGEIIGVFTLTRQIVRAFTEKQIELVQTFADQAVIAIENARLFDEVQAKTRDLSESLQQQTATADVLKAISRSAFDLETVLNALVEAAARLCEADQGTIARQHGDVFVRVASWGFSDEFNRLVQNLPVRAERGSATGRALLERRTVHIADVDEDPEYTFADAKNLGGFKTIIAVPMLREGLPIGVLALTRIEGKPFTSKQIELVETFSDQAAIAIENVRLFEEVQAKTSDLAESLQFQTATSNVLRVISRSPDNLQPVLDVIVETSRELCTTDASSIFLLRDQKFYLAAVSGSPAVHLGFMQANPLALDAQGSVLPRAIREKRTIHIPNVAEDSELIQGSSGRGGPRALLAAPLMSEGQAIGVLVLRQSHLKPFTKRQIGAAETFADQAVIAISNVDLFEQVQQRTRELSQSLDNLRAAQDRLIQTEKLASLGQLTAGIAHEIKNPLNFVNNFSALSVELVDEITDVLDGAGLNDKRRGEFDEIRKLLKSNLEKVVQHGKRADSIVKNMLLHSRSGSGEYRPVEINAVIDESLNLAYHGARAERKDFNITLERDFDPAAGVAEIYLQEITRVFLNLISNGFYAATKRAAEAGNGFEPRLTAVTRNLGEEVEIRIRDNGMGIPPDIREKIFNPFFTTKPAGEGTGLGLSMSHDIVVKQHGGTIDVTTEPGAFTEFVITLPRTAPVQEMEGGKKT